MEIVNSMEKYYKIFKEEKKCNYKYSPILNKNKNRRKRISQLLYNNIKIKKLKISHQKEKDNEKNKTNNDNLNLLKNKSNLINDISSGNKEFILEENFFLAQIKKKKQMLDENKSRIKGYFTKLQCPCCQKEMSSKEKLSKTSNQSSEQDIINNYYKNKNFKDIKSCFIYGVNNFPLINLRTHFRLYSDNEEKVNMYKTTYNKKVDMKSELSKNKKIKKIKEVKRENIDINNLYKIEKPLITSIRGKIYKNMRQRFKRPLRLIILNEYNNPMYHYHSYNN